MNRRTRPNSGLAYLIMLLCLYVSLFTTEIEHLGTLASEDGANSKKAFLTEFLKKAVAEYSPSGGSLTFYIGSALAFFPCGVHQGDGDM